jgi:F-type H+-transporting ATPase subunit delta
MAESVTIARPYAEAVFRLARDSKNLSRWADRLALLATVAADAEMQQCIGNPKLSAAQLTDLFVSLSNEGNDAELVSFVRALADNERLAVLPQIRELFDALKSDEEGVKEAVVYSAFPLDDAQVNNLMGQLETYFKTKLQPRVEVEPELIGGIKVAVGDQVLDASVRGKLEAMASALKN